MSREHAPVAPGRARAPIRRAQAPSGDHGGRAAIRPATRAAARTEGAKALIALAAVLVLAGALLLRAGGIHAGTAGPWAPDSAVNRHAAAPAIDPRLILTPRTATLAATAAGVQMALTTNPLLPGPNHFALRLAERGRPLTGARVLLQARMIGMAMRPIMLPMREPQPGRYTATGPLAMFGSWQVSVRIDRPGAAPLTRQFTVSMDLPADLFTAQAAGGAPQR